MLVSRNPAGQLGADADDTKLSYGARSPTLLNGLVGEPLHRTRMMFVLRDHQGHEHTGSAGSSL